ncbi:putative membrane protein YpjA [Alkalibacillus flavidus]|uniref:Membrane protein YpjA n=1 Tax=Alkalibacillus flavidus TaxID=546021 RepID=A0ABV2KRY5_9BACI
MLKYLLLDRTFLMLLFIINFLGTIYGYYWYRLQFEVTPPIFLAFVPDSPTASLFFVIVLAGFLIGRHFSYIEALAMVTLFKYGTWAVVMNILTFFNGQPVSFMALMLIVSHGAMAIQALLYAPFYKIEWRHLVVASIWTLHNDIIDYVYGQMPMYPTLAQYEQHIGYFTFWLSLLSITLVYLFCIKRTTSYELSY